MNNITIELCADDRARLDRLVAALEAIQIDASKVAKPDPESTSLDDVQQRLAETIAKTEKIENIESPAPTVTEADIRSIARTLIEQGKKPQLKAIVDKYAPSISGIPEESMPLVYEELKVLVGV